MGAIGRRIAAEAEERKRAQAYIDNGILEAERHANECEDDRCLCPMGSLMDICGDCGGELLMTAGTPDELMAECEECHSLWAWDEFGGETRKVADRLQHWLGLLSVPAALWLFSGMLVGGQW